MRFLALVLAALAPMSVGNAVAETVSGPTLRWFTDGHPTRQAIDIISELQHAEDRGLRPEDYNVSGWPPSTARNLPQVDASLSRAVARFVSDLHSGRVDPRKLDYDLDVVRPKFDVPAMLEILALAPAVSAALDGIEPQFLHYRLLKSVLARYRRLALHPELNSLPDPGRKPVKPGGVYTGASGLRRLLAALGDRTAGPASTEQRLDPDLVRALQTFQARHGLSADGVLGRETYHALTTSFTERVTQIELSMERWRWLPPKLETPSIIVNIPEFRLFAFYTTADIERHMLRMDVIVGNSFPLMQTPVFAADMRYIVLNPYWDVPYSIVKRELLPFILRDPDYIARNEYEIVRGQTDVAAVQPVTAQTLDELARGNLRLRQRPGPKNPLGFVKFMLPNRHSVYLHGTSAPALFGGAHRAFSHGCIRVADPMALMSYVLRDDPEWDQQRLLKQLRQPGPYRINLRKPIRVFIVYATALAAEDGRALFFRDIYGQDARLQALLQARTKHLLQPALADLPGS